MDIHQEINQNMTVSAGGGFALNNDELEGLKNNQVWANSRANRRKSVADKTTNRQNTHNWINASSLMEPNNCNIAAQQRTNENQSNRHVAQPNNKTSTEDLDTIRENIRNSNESVRKSSSENILEIEENMRKNSMKSVNATLTDGNTSITQSRNNPLTLPLANKQTVENTTLSNNSTADLYQSPTSPTAKDPHTAYIDLSNNCRQFYFSHLKTAEAIKQSVRASKHTKALDKVHGKPTSVIDNAMDRLRAEMVGIGIAKLFYYLDATFGERENERERERERKGKGRGGRERERERERERGK